MPRKNDLEICLELSNMVVDEDVGAVNDCETKTDSVTTTTLDENVETITPPIREGGATRMRNSVQASGTFKAGREKRTKRLSRVMKARRNSTGSKNVHVVSTRLDNLESQTGPTTTSTPNASSVSGATTARVYKKNDDFMKDDDLNFPITKNYQFCFKPCRRLCCHTLVDTIDLILRQERKQLLLQIQPIEEETPSRMVKHMEAKMDCLMGMCCKKPKSFSSIGLIFCLFCTFLPLLVLGLFYSFVALYTLILVIIVVPCKCKCCRSVSESCCKSSVSSWLFRLGQLVLLGVLFNGVNANILNIFSPCRGARWVTLMHSILVLSK